MNTKQIIARLNQDMPATGDYIEDIDLWVKFVININGECFSVKI